MPQRNWLITRPFRGSLQHAKRSALLMGLYSLVPFLVGQYVELPHQQSPPSILYAALGLTLSVLLVLRTNTAYDRWWEGRKFWGRLVNVSRNLVIKTRAFAGPEPEEMRAFAARLSEFAVVLRDHLRAGAPTLATTTADQPAHHRPSRVVSEIYEQMGGWLRSGLLDGERLRTLDLEARELLEICGGCERIVKTPLARSYRTFMRQGVWLYLLFLPWGLGGELRYMTIPLTVIQTYLFIAIDELARAIENPFGNDEDDLDLDSICRAIEQSLRDLAG